MLQPLTVPAGRLSVAISESERYDADLRNWRSAERMLRALDSTIPAQTHKRRNRIIANAAILNRVIVAAVESTPADDSLLSQLIIHGH